MSTSAVGSSPPVRVPEAMEPKGRDRDGDADDRAAQAAYQAPVQAAAPAGQGKLVDKSV